MAFSRAKQAFRNAKGEVVHAVVTVSVTDTQLNSVLTQLLNSQTQQALLNADSAAKVVALLDGKDVDVASQTASAVNQVVGTFTIRNEHGLHARPGALLVSTVKPFAAKVTVENLDRPGNSVNAKSLMKLVALGVVAGHRLRFVAEGDDAKAAIEAVGKAIAEGLGEGVGVSPKQPDSIEEIGVTSATAATSPQSIAEQKTAEGIFSLKNEHGLHARPCALLVQEAKKYQAAITVENLDRQSAAVNAKSMMKVVALGALKNHKLRFVATGEDAQAAIDAIGAAIAAGLGE